MAKNMVQVRSSGGGMYSAPDVKLGRSSFNRSHRHKTTFNASKLVPILVDEVLPGDTFTCSMNGFARIFSPLDAPVMDDIEVETHFFFVPTRLLWDNWENFLGAHDAAGAQDTTYTVPIISQSSAFVVPEGTVGHYMGLPKGLDFQDVKVISLPGRAYRLIYNEWFRDQNLIDEVTFDSGDGPDSVTYYTYAPYNSAKKHDYFTSALPYLQKGDVQTMFGVSSVDVETLAVQGNNVTVESGSGQRDLDASTADLTIDTTNTGSPLFIDLTGVGFDINSLRESLAIQRMLERDARAGTRYNEQIKAHFGVTVPDFRVQRPEYLGGSRGYINISPVANTSDTASADQGELKGVGTGIISGGWAKSFVEHGYIVGLIRARGTLSYFQGLDRMWSRQTREEFYYPELANLGEQAVLNKELYISNTPATDDAAFGYQERWAEYRFKKSLITGNFDPNVSGSLSFWHLSEDFSSLPALNQTFIEDHTPMDRITTVDTEDDFIVDINFDYRCARPIPVRSIPSLLGMRF